MAAQETEVFKGELQGCLDGGRGQDDIVSSDSHLDLRDMAVHSASSWLFEYSQSPVSAFDPASWGQFLEVERLMSQLLSDHHVTILSSRSHLPPPGERTSVFEKQLTGYGSEYYP